MSSGSFKKFIYKMYLETIHLIYMYKKDMALNNLEWLICHKTKPNSLNVLTVIESVNLLLERQFYSVAHISHPVGETLNKIFKRCICILLNTVRNYCLHKYIGDVFSFFKT